MQDIQAALSEEKHLEFVKQCEIYMDQLKSREQLIAAQPLMRDGVIISKKDGVWKTILLDLTTEVQVGYYHVTVNNIDEAIEIAKNNPEFAYVPSGSIEVRPIKVKEEKTDFVYPK